MKLPSCSIIWQLRVTLAQASFGCAVSLHLGARPLPSSIGRSSEAVIGEVLWRCSSDKVRSGTARHTGADCSFSGANSLFAAHGGESGQLPARRLGVSGRDRSNEPGSARVSIVAAQ